MWKHFKVTIMRGSNVFLLQSSCEIDSAFMNWGVSIAQRNQWFDYLLYSE